MREIAQRPLEMEDVISLRENVSAKAAGEEAIVKYVSQ